MASREGLRATPLGWLLTTVKINITQETFLSSHNLKLSVLPTSVRLWRESGENKLTLPNMSKSRFLWRHVWKIGKNLSILPDRTFWDHSNSRQPPLWFNMVPVHKSGLCWRSLENLANERLRVDGWKPLVGITTQDALIGYSNRNQKVQANQNYLCI